MRLIRLVAVVLAATPFACTRDNPIFGDETGGGDASSDSSTVGVGTDASATTNGQDGESGTTGGCGDNTIGADEECDDGEQNGSEGAPCTATCRMNVCGDGHRGPGELCDDGNLNPDDGCRNDCSLASCGNGTTDPGEDCDDANPDDTDACLSTCVDASCGDGKKHAGVEQCDDGNLSNEDHCLVECIDNVCSDGWHDKGVEECDDGDQVETNGCTNGCTVPACNDGIVSDSEACEPGQALPTCGELDPGFGGGMVTCFPDTCELDIRCCGDGNVDVGEMEECDDPDANMNTCDAAGLAGDGVAVCSAQCTWYFPGGGDSCCIEAGQPCGEGGPAAAANCCGQAVCDQMQNVCVGG